MSSDPVVPLLQEILARLNLLEGQIGQPGAVSAAAAPAAKADTPAAIQAFDEYLATKLQPFVAACKKLGGDAALGGEAIDAAWQEMRKIILMASQCREPAATDMPKVIAEVASKMKAVGALVKRNEWEKHMKALSEGVSACNWLVVKPAPRDVIESTVGGSDYWANSVRKEYRTTNPDQIAFCDTFKALLLGLVDYVKAHHLTGLSWNAKGGNWSEFNASAAAPAAAPAPALAAAAAKPTTSAAPAGNLFAELNKEGAITSGLKKVTKDMQTWRAEYNADAAPAPAPAPKAAPVAPRPAASQVKGPPKLEFQAGPSKWLVENQSEAQGLVRVEIGEKKETVYIFGCVGATIEIVGKCKSIVVDSCKKTAVHFETAMASCEIVNCARMQIHCRESVPSVAIDKTDGIVVHLPRTSLHTEVVASKSSEMNLSWPDENGDMIEKPVPEQYVHRIVNNAVTANVSDLYTH